jgi:acetyltransferase
MSIRNLDYLFKPRSIALIGASREPLSPGAVVARNLFDSGFRGPIMPVSRDYRAIEGVLAYSEVAALPVVADLAVIATPAPTVPSLIGELGAAGTRAAIIISGSFSMPDDPSGAALRQSMLEAARRHTLRIIGPDCLGVVVPEAGLNTSVTPATPKRGHLAFITQSGAVFATVLDWATTRGIGFSHLASLGDMTDVDFGDMLDYLGSEVDVRGILLYMEAITDARKFMSAARAASRLKPVIVVKAGRFSPDGAAAASSPIDQDAVYDAAFRRAGMLRVRGIDDLFGTVETLGTGRVARGNRLAILADGSGLAVLACDALLELGGSIAQLAAETRAGLAPIAPIRRDNPIVLARDVAAEGYGRAVKLLLADRSTDAVLAIHSPNAAVPPLHAARAIVNTLQGSNATVLACWLGESGVGEARRLFTASRIPSYHTPEHAIRAFIQMVTFRHNQEMLTQTPPSVPEEFTPDAEAARSIIDQSAAAGREWLTEPDAMAVLAAYRIPVVPTQVAADPAAAARAAAAVGGPVVLKILSPDIRHKSAVDGVALDLRAPVMVGQAAEQMLQRLAQVLPAARIDGFTVQPLIHRPGGLELVISALEDSHFGPVIRFGHGGTAVDIINDTAIALPPLNMHLARDVMMRTRIAGLLQHNAGRPAMALDDVALTLIKVSQLIIDLAEVAELTINPLVVDQFGVIALDAHMRLRAATAPAARRFAIRPYPKELEEVLTLPDGRSFLLRPVLPEDEPAFQALFARLTPQDVRMRFFAPKKVLTHPLAARMTQIDYDREMALVLAEPGIAGRSPIFGVVHIAADPDGERAEYSIMLRSDMGGLGLGPMLMRRIIDYGRQRGLKEIYGEVLRENRPMLKVCDLFKFKRLTRIDDPTTVEVSLRL